MLIWSRIIVNHSGVYSYKRITRVNTPNPPHSTALPTPLTPLHAAIINFIIISMQK